MEKNCVKVCTILVHKIELLFTSNENQKMNKFENIGLTTL